MSKVFEQEAIFHDFDRNAYEFSYPRHLIFSADQQWNYGREPVLRPMPDGTLICLIYSGGRREPSPSNCVLITRSYDNGVTWDSPQILFSHTERAVWATEISVEGENPVIYLHTYVFNTFFCELRTFQSETRDNGKSWSEPVSIQGVCPNLVARKCITTSNDTIIMPVYWTENTTGFNWESYLPAACEEGAPVLFMGPKWHFVSGVLRSVDCGKHGPCTATFITPMPVELKAKTFGSRG